MNISEFCFSIVQVLMILMWCFIIRFIIVVSKRLLLLVDKATSYFETKTDYYKAKTNNLNNNNDREAE